MNLPSAQCQGLASNFLPRAAVLYLVTRPLPGLLGIDRAVSLARLAGGLLRRLGRFATRQSIPFSEPEAHGPGRPPSVPGSKPGGAADRSATLHAAIAMAGAVERLGGIKLFRYRPLFPTCLSRSLALAAGLAYVGIPSAVTFGVFSRTPDNPGRTMGSDRGLPPGTHDPVRIGDDTEIEAHARVIASGMVVSEGPEPFPYDPDGAFRVLKSL